MADAAIGVILVLGLVGGLRRGFFKEAVAVLSILVATWVTIQAYGAAGPFVAEKLGLRGDVGYLVAGIACWIAAYFASVLVGNLIWKKLRGKGPLQQVADAAEGTADAAAGKTRPGPVTLMLKPLPTRAGVLYWIDKVLGAALGVAQAALIILVVLIAAMALPLGRAGQMIRGSNAYGLFRSDVEPQLSALPEVKIVRSIGDVSRVVDDVEEDPRRLERLRRHQAFAPLQGYKPFQALAEDKELVKALEEKHYAAALKSPKVLGLLKDREFLKLLSEIDWQKVRADLAAEDAKAAAEEKNPPLPAPPKKEGE